jgi:localization factor PodJL
MKSGIPWNLKRVDEETRQAVIEAARRSGMSVGDWLNQTLAPEGQRYAEPEQPPAEPRDFSAAIGRLRNELDAIGRRLGQPPPPRQPRSVPEMVAELAREIENPDERARTLVEGARARSAPAVGVEPASDRLSGAIRDLDRQIAEMGERFAMPPPTLEPGPVRLEDIRHHLNQLLARAPLQAEPPAPSRAEPTVAVEAALRALETRIDDAKTQLGVQSQTAASEQMARLEAQLVDIGARLTTASAEPQAQPKRVELASAIREISAHQRTIDDRAETQAMRREQKALSAAINALRADIAQLGEQVGAVGRTGTEEQGALFDLARRIDMLSSERPIDRNLLSEIRNDLDTLKATAGDGAREATLGRINKRHDELAGQINALLAGAANRRQVEALAEEVAGLRHSVESDDSPNAIARIEARVVDLGHALDSVLAAQQSSEPTPILEQLEERLREISRRVDSLRDAGPQTAAIAGLGNRLEERLDEIAGRLSTLPDPSAQTAAINAAQRQMEERLEDVVAHLGGVLAVVPRQTAALDSIRERLEALVERIDELGAVRHEPAAELEAIRAEIRALRAELAQKVVATPQTDHLEAQIRDLAAQLETVAELAPDGQALALLERRVAEIAEDVEEAKPRVAALAQVEQNLARLQDHLADATRQSIVGARAEAQQAVTQLSELVAQYEIDSDLVRNLMRDLDAVKEAAGVGDARGRLESVSRTLGDVVDRLARLEQGTGRTVSSEAGVTSPASVLAAVNATDATAEVIASPPEARTADRRADFIAAARRAAQAAAARVASDQYSPARAEAAATPEVSPPVAEQTATERKPGAFARITQAIRGRKKPLLLAAAAIVIAIGAMQIYDRLSTAKDETSLSTAAIAPAPVIDAPALPEPTQFRDVAAEARAASVPTVPQVAEDALVPPPATPDAAIAFAQPEPVADRFEAGPALPESSSFSAMVDGPDDELAGLVATPATEVAAEMPLPPGQISGLDPRIGGDRLLTAADDGDPAAAFEVARRYADGAQVPKNLAKAAEWYRRAAEGGIAVAQYRLASLYERGQGVPRNLVDAVNWYQRAADQGNVNAMHNLAVLMSEGVEGPPDHDKALQWFLAAADYGVRDSQYNLGVIYARGLGPTQDLVQSYKWFAIAAGQGDTDASARRDEVAKAMNPEELARARGDVAAWRVKPTIAEANGVTPPPGGWDGNGVTIADADRQALVRKIQILLAEQGYDPGPADGVAGPKTVEAVRAYQRQTGQPETGEIDATLVAALAGSPM